jgi:[ribosomal protein S5]-alanine N-acetyltransferase
MDTLDVRIPRQIETERLILREPRIDDAKPIFEAYGSDPQVTRFLSLRTSRSSDEVEEFLRASARRQQERQAFFWVIERKDSGTLIGMIMISLKVSNFAPELGFALARASWGLGYMSEAAGTLTRWLLAQQAIERVWAVCDVDNAGSQRVLEKIGLEREGRLRRWAIYPNISERPRDVYVYSAVKGP